MIDEKTLQIAICMPKLKPLRTMLSGEDATYVVQGYIVSGLQARGHQLTYLAPRKHEGMICTRDLDKPEPAPQTWSRRRWFRYTSKIAWRTQRLLGIPYLNFFSNYRYFDACLQCLPGNDVVYERHDLYNVGVAMACQRLKLPYVLFFEADQIHEHQLIGTPITGLLLRRARKLVRYNLRTANAIICVSEPAKEQLISNWGVSEKKIVVFPNGVNVQQFHPSAEPKAELRRALGLDDNPTILFVGNFYPWHDVETLLVAFSQVINTYPDARLLLVGEGTRRQAMVKQAVDLRIDHAVHFTGLVDHSKVPGLVRASDIAVAPAPSLKHGLLLSPLKLYEYMASGTAVVASEVGQLAAVIYNGCNGLLVPPDDVTALAEALELLIGNQELREKLGLQAREDAVRKHSWDTYVSRLERLFTAVIDNQPLDVV